MTKPQKRRSMSKSDLKWHDLMIVPLLFVSATVPCDESHQCASVNCVNDYFEVTGLLIE